MATSGSHRGAFAEPVASRLISESTTSSSRTFDDVFTEEQLELTFVFQRRTVLTEDEVGKIRANTCRRTVFSEQELERPNRMFVERYSPVLLDEEWSSPVYGRSQARRILEAWPELEGDDRVRAAGFAPTNDLPRGLRSLSDLAAHEASWRKALPPHVDDDTSCL